MNLEDLLASARYDKRVTRLGSSKASETSMVMPEGEKNDTHSSTNKKAMP
jgi:hypothetical protein